MEKDYYSDLINQQAKKEESEQKAKQEKTGHEEQEKRFQIYLHGLVEESLRTISDEQKESLKNAFLTKMEGNSFFKTALSSYGFDHPVIQ